MKRVLLFTAALLTVHLLQAQGLKKLADRAKQKVEQRVNGKVDAAMDKGLDEVEGKGTGQGQPDANGEGGTAAGAAPKGETMQAYSKYDFVQGEKVIAYEDFATTAVGDFPTRWNTNGTAEVVTLNNKEGKWLKFSKELVFHPEFIKELPENFTLEMDVAVNPGWYSSVPLVLNIAQLAKPEEYTDYYHYVRWTGKHALHMQFRPAAYYGGSTNQTANARLQTAKDGNYLVNNNIDFKSWDNGSNNWAHISLWRQGPRLRLYINGQKLYDVPRAFDPEAKYNAVTLATNGLNQEQDYFLIGNLRLAAGAPDTRNKLITEGKFVTTGITFDVASDKLKPTSQGVLKEIATALSENGEVRIRIVGHTDSDGDDAKNMDLSRRRAEAVKASLAKDFGIAADRIETAGQGESVPVGDNKTAEGKAQNRRVEFINLSKAK